MSSEKGNGRPGKRLSFFSANMQEEDEGRWEPLPSMPEVAFKLRSLHCDDVQDWITNETQRQQKLQDTLELDGKTQSLIFRQAVAEKLMVGWRGLLEDNGDYAIFSREKAKEIMTGRPWRRLSDAISNLIVARSKVLYEERDDLGKGSESSSVTDFATADSPRATAS